MDAATIKGVIDRLIKRGIASTRADPTNKRRLLVELTEDGRLLADDMVDKAKAITEATLSPLSADEREVFLSLLQRLR